MSSTNETIKYIWHFCAYSGWISNVEAAIMITKYTKNAQVPKVKIQEIWEKRLKGQYPGNTQIWEEMQRNATI